MCARLSFVPLGIVVAFTLATPSKGRCEEPPRSQEKIAAEEAMAALEPQETEYGHRSTSAMVTGIVLTSTGGAALIGGFFFALLNGFMVEGGNETAETAGAVMMGTGAAGILIGVPLTVYGAQDDTSRYDSGGEPRVQLAISPTSVGLHGRF